MRRAEAELESEPLQDMLLSGDLTRLSNLINSLPSDRNLTHIYSDRAAVVRDLRTKLARASGGVKLQARPHRTALFSTDMPLSSVCGLTLCAGPSQALWSGYIFKKGRFSGWSRRFLVVRAGVVLLWAKRSDAIDGAPATSRIFLCDVSRSRYDVF